MDLNAVLENFIENIESVSKLINFDKEVQEFAVNGVESLHIFLKEKRGFDNPQWNGERTLEMLRSIRTSPALRDRYATIFNQAVVLLVSYFGSALGDIFRLASARELDKNNTHLLNAELKISVRDVLSLRDSAATLIGDLLIQKDGITFQDMQSTHRAFDRYFSVKLEVNDNVRNIIVGQACRHAIVHNGAIANNQTVKQIRNALPRKLKPSIQAGEKIEFTTREVGLLSEEMKLYLSDLLSKIDKVQNS